jgi:hypothetical protein
MKPAKSAFLRTLRRLLSLVAVVVWVVIMAKAFQLGNKDIIILKQEAEISRPLPGPGRAHQDRRIPAGRLFGSPDRVTRLGRTGQQGCRSLHLP